MKYDNESGAAGLFTLVLVFLFASIMFVCIGFGIDKIVMTSQMFAGTAASQMRFETVKYMLTVFRIEPMILLIVIGIQYWVTEMRQTSTMQDVSTTVFAAFEMIVMTLVLIAFTLFGGAGIDAIVNFTNNWSMGGAPDPSMYGVIQYISPLFYGTAFLILIGVIITFIMQSVRTVDFTQTM